MFRDYRVHRPECGQRKGFSGTDGQSHLSVKVIDACRYGFMGSGDDPRASVSCHVAG